MPDAEGHTETARERADAIVKGVLAEALSALEEREGLRGIEALVRGEARLASFAGAGQGTPSPPERAAVHAFHRLRMETDRLLPKLRPFVRFPDDLRTAFEREVDRGLLLARAFMDLGWFTPASVALTAAELPLGYLGPEHPRRFEWLRQRASWGFASREIDAARDATTSYRTLVVEAEALPEGELERVARDLHGWLDVQPVRELVAVVRERASRESIDVSADLVAWEVASTLYHPWDQALEAELEARLGAPSPALLRSLVDRIEGAGAARLALGDDPVLRADDVADAARAVGLLDRLGALATGSVPDLARRAYVVAEEHTLDVLARLADAERNELMHPVERQLAREIAEADPLGHEARSRRIATIRSLGALDARALAAVVADPALGSDEALGLARDRLTFPPDDASLDLAAALVDRTALSTQALAGQPAPDEGATLAAARVWLDRARDGEGNAATDARELLAWALELGGDAAGALELYEGLADELRGRDHERWVRAVERCAMLAKQTGALGAAGRAARSGFRPGGRVQAPGADLPMPTDPLDAEDEAERAVAIGMRSTDPEIGEAWLRRALALWERVPDGRRREDEIWERIADHWQDEADALFEEGDASSDQLDEAHRRAHDALVRAIRVNEELGDGERVFELSGRVLGVLWTWLTRWEDAHDAFLSLARNRFSSALVRGDLDHAAACLVELRAHLADLRADASELGASADEEMAEVLERFESLEREMTTSVAAESERLGEPWWIERLEARAR